jgi:hypothetical protein
MPDSEPVSAEPMAGATTPTPWARARGHLEAATPTYWLATVRHDVYEVTPTVAFGFGTDETLVPTRWRFGGRATR